MKTPNPKLMLAACLVAGNSFAQYGWKNYSHPQSTNGMLSSAKNTYHISYVAPGYINSVSYNSCTNGEYNFILDRTDTDGDLTTAFCFSKGYRIFDDMTSCNASTNAQALKCSGTDALLTLYTTSGAGYAVAGSYPGGLFFSTLDINGFPITTSTIRWGKPGDKFGKPILIESINQANWYYICAPLGNGTFIAKVDNAGTVAFANVYNGITNLNPRSIVHHPFAQNELAVVGMATDDVVAADEGFFMRVDAATGMLIDLNLYGDGITGDEWFNTIKYSYGSGYGYIVGGHQYSGQLQNVNNRPWVLKMDLNGNVLWDRLIQPATTGKCIEITDAVERLSNPPEYYFSGGCNTSTADNIGVWKMDQTGSNTSFASTEFVYNVGSGNTLSTRPMSTQLEINGNGLHAWSTNFTNGDYRFSKAYYNGVNGCNNTWINKLSSGMVTRYPVAIVTNPYVSACTPYPTNFQLDVAILSPMPTSCWTPGQVPGGSNVRTMATTGIESQEASVANNGVYPNPTSGKVNISFKVEAGATAKIDLRNTLGQVVKTIDTGHKTGGNYTEEIDMDSMHLSSGIYFVDVTSSGMTTSHKVVYQAQQ